MNEDELDVLVVGSSPLLLLEALALHHEGRRVTVAEAADRFGGAWSTRPLWEFESVEVACHYIERGRRGYAFLRDQLGLELAPRAFQAVWIHADGPGEHRSAWEAAGGWVVRKALWGRFLSDDVWGVIKSVGRRDPFKFGRAVRRMLTLPPYLYPVGGARALVDALVRAVRGTSVVLLGGARVDDVALGDGGRPTRCRLAGRACSVKTLVVGEHVYPRLPLAGAGGSGADGEYEVNVLLRVDGAKAVPFDYIEIHRNDVVNRVADVSPFARRAGSARPGCDDLLVCCNLTRRGTRDEPADPGRIFDHVVALGLLAPGAELVDAHVERYPSPLGAPVEPTDAVRVIRTWDLGVLLQRNADRWPPLR